MDNTSIWSECSVECYSGHTYAQEPRAVVTQSGQRFPVAQVEERWRTPSGPVFRVRTQTGDRLDLAYIESDGRWTVSHLAPDETGT